MSEDTPEAVSFEEGAALLTDRATFEGTVQIDGATIPIEVDEPTLEELEEIEAGLPEDAEEVDVAREMVDRYLVRPDIEPETLGITRALAVFAGLPQTWQQALLELAERAETYLEYEQNQRGQAARETGDRPEHFGDVTESRRSAFQ